MIDEFHGLSAEEWKAMTAKKSYACPRCEYALIPVHAVEGSKRRVIALTCPEPYCDHMQMIPRGKAGEVEDSESNGESGFRRAVN